MEINRTHEKIINVLKNKGPSLPIQLVKEIGMSSLFISAFLSELADEKRIKVSHLKVGGSPLYFLEGQEGQLERFYKYLHPKEAETFLLLKKRKILKDSEQEPAVRVALRSIRDFSIGFKKDDEIYWRYFLTLESEIREMLEPKKIKQKSPPEKQRVMKKEFETLEVIKIKKPESEFDNPLVISSKSKKQKPKSNFVLKTISFLKSNSIKILEEKDCKAKEYRCITQINSQLGPINFLTQAKDKKTISETDLKKLLSDSQKIPLPAFMLYTGEISKKAREYLKKYFSVLKAVKSQLKNNNI